MGIVEYPESLKEIHRKDGKRKRRYSLLDYQQRIPNPMTPALMMDRLFQSPLDRGKSHRVGHSQEVSSFMTTLALRTTS